MSVTTSMSERQGPGHGLSEHELSEIRMLIEERTGIHFDPSRERFFSTRVREHLHAKEQQLASDLLRTIRKSNVEYEALLEGPGLRPGVVLSSILAAISLLDDHKPTLLARVSGTSLTTAIVR